MKMLTSSFKKNGVDFMTDISIVNYIFALFLKFKGNNDGKNAV